MKYPIEKLSKEKRESFEKELKEHKDNYNLLLYTGLIINYLFYSILFWLVVFPLWYMAFSEKLPTAFIEISLSSLVIFKGLFFALIAAFIIDYARMIKYVGERIKIKRKYFNIKVEAKK